ncbi:MAG: DUF4097 family beta strand repeat-containing protein [candidate division Zixibacteria bacterium]|nr:DUF4097 family beta strand repeat-containing protein [candidate division Zixibacteria bacterium]
MECFRRVMRAALVGLMIMSVNAFAGRGQEETKTYQGIETIRLNTISGDCIIRKGAGTDVTVEVSSSYQPRDSFEPRFNNRGKVLKLSEEMYGSNSGSSTWTLTVPDSIEISFNSASGDLEISELQGDFSAETASGDIRAEECGGAFKLSSASGSIDLRNCTGDVRVSAASGDIQLTECGGEFEVSSASGDVDVDGVTLKESGSFSSASGNVLVILAATPEYDLSVGSASGEATLNYNGNPLNGRFEFTANYRHGRISAPVTFDGEDRYERHGDRYISKWFTKGPETPLISLSTGSGQAVLLED